MIHRIDEIAIAIDQEERSLSKEGTMLKSIGAERRRPCELTVVREVLTKDRITLRGRRWGVTTYVLR